MEFNGAFRDLQPLGDFLVRQIPSDQDENVSLAAAKHSRRPTPRTAVKELGGAGNQTAHQILPNRYSHCEISGILIVR
jgi:hypothetical protein